MLNDSKVAVIIVAAGASKRMGQGVNKQLIEVENIPVVERSIISFENNDFVDEIIIAIKEDVEGFKREIIKDKFKKVRKVVLGGKERQDSVRNAFNEVSLETKIVLVHDGARPFASERLINQVIEKTYEHGAASPLLPVKDSLKAVKEGFIEKTLNRDEIYRIQTPQGFKKDILEKALKKGEELGLSGTDETVLLEYIKGKVFAVEGDEENIKITTPFDVAVSKAIAASGEKSLNIPDIRTGLGYDVHKLVEGRKLILGGVEIPHSKGLLGHSDADVLVHAIMDAILGASGMYDIGRHFPDTKDEFKGISSLELLRKTIRITKEKKFKILNIDATIIAEKPKVAKYIDEMRRNISEIVDIEFERINVKATTTETLGFCGREEGISANAIATVVKM